MIDLRSLVERDTTLRRAAATNGGEYAGPCPGCGGRDRFRVWPDKGRYWCRQCGRKGDPIQYLRDFHGFSFVEAKRQLGLSTAPPLSEEAEKQRCHRYALQVAHSAFEAWARHKLTELADEYRELSAEREAVEIAYRLLHRRPDLFSEAEARQWEAKLAETYDRLAPLEWCLDIFTYREHEQARCSWWREEVERGRFST